MNELQHCLDHRQLSCTTSINNLVQELHCEHNWNIQHSVGLNRARNARQNCWNELYDHSDVHNTTGAAPAAIPQFSALSVPKLVVAQNGNDNEVQELQLWNPNGLLHNNAVQTCLCEATGISTTLLMN